MSDNFTEKWVHQKDGCVRYERYIPSVPEWQFFKVELLITRSYFDWCKIHKPESLKLYVNYATAFVLARNGISNA